MGSWTKDTITTGAVATAGTTAAVALLAKMEGGNAVAAINAVSHMFWGEEATDNDHLDARHTLAGLGLNTAAVTGWAALHELLLPRSGPVTPQRALLTAAGVTLLAYWVDYYVVPKRFTPGFEKQLSRRSLAGVYAVLALTLAAGSLGREH